MHTTLPGITLPPNIVVLTRTSCHTDITNKPVDGLTIDLENRTWNYQRPKNQFKNDRIFKFGECNHSAKNCSSGVVGVYDISEIEQLRAMNRHSYEMIDSGRESFDD